MLTCDGQRRGLQQPPNLILMEICFLGRAANVENGDRGPADFSHTAFNPGFI